MRDERERGDELKGLDYKRKVEEALSIITAG